MLHGPHTMLSKLLASTGKQSFSTCSHGGEDRPLQDQPKHLHLRLIDFGSAIDNHSTHNLYGPQGPSSAEQTVEYAPPEAVLGRYLVRHGLSPADRMTPSSTAHLCTVKS